MVNYHHLFPLRCNYCSSENIVLSLETMLHASNQDQNCALAGGV